jgi:hypothetical protein
MTRPATPQDVSAIISRLERLPRLGQPLRRAPKERETLYHLGLSLITQHGYTTGEVERSLRAELHDIYAP